MAARQHPSPWAVTGWVISALGLIVAVLGLLVPNVRDWLADNGIVAWVVALGVVVLGPGACALVIKQRFNHARLRADIELAKDQLGEWTLDSDFYTALSDGINWKAFPSEYRGSIFNHIYRWERDKRVIEESTLAAKFSQVQAAARELDDQIGTYLWLEGTERLSIPREWDGVQRKEAYDGLNPAADQLEKALGDLHALLHRLGTRTRA